MAVESIKSTIGKVCESIQKLYNSVRPAAMKIPPILLACSMAKRPGLSSIVSIGNIIKNMSEYGIPTEAGPDGTENMNNVMVKCIVEEVYRALKEDANIQVATKPLSMRLTGTGANSSGPVQVVGTNVNCGESVGLIQ